MKGKNFGLIILFSIMLLCFIFGIGYCATLIDYSETGDDINYTMFTEIDGSGNVVIHNETWIEITQLAKGNCAIYEDYSSGDITYCKYHFYFRLDDATRIGMLQSEPMSALVALQTNQERAYSTNGDKVQLFLQLNKDEDKLRYFIRGSIGLIDDFGGYSSWFYEPFYHYIKFIWSDTTNTVEYWVYNVSNDVLLEYESMTSAYLSGYKRYFYVLNNDNRGILSNSHWTGDIYGAWAYWGEKGIPELLDSSLYDINGNIINITSDNYLFMGEYYELRTYWNNTNIAIINFTDGEHIINFVFLNETSEVFLNATDEFVIGSIKVSFNRTNPYYANVTWGFILDKNIVDAFNVDFNYICYNDIMNYTSGSTSIINMIIYNLGGFVTYEFGGDGGHTTGGDIFELYATNGSLGSYAYAESIFRKLQHVHLLVEIFMDNEWDGVNGEFDIVGGVGYVEYGFDYRLSGSWIEGWKCRIYVSTANVGHHNGGSDHDWVMWIIEWYNNGVKIKEDILYSNHWGYDNENAVPEYHNRTSSQFWVDLWFNKMNSSTVICGRVNSYYYGMYEQGLSWWFGYGTFRPMMGETTASMFFDDLYDENDEVTNCKKFNLIRAWAKVVKLNDASGNDETWRLQNYEILNWKCADDRMEGIDTPIFVETKVLDMPQTGFLQPLYKAIEGISTAIWKGALGFVKIFISSIDTILSYLGSPVTMSQLINFIMIQASYITSWMQQLLLRVSDMLNVFAQMIIFVTQLIVNTTSAILWILIYVTAFPLVVLRFIIAIINGEPYTLYGHIFDFTNTHEIISAGLQLAPTMIGFMFVCWIVFGDIYMEKNDVEGIPKRILQMFGYMKEAYNNVYWIFNRIRNEIISLYNFIRSHIPSIGGGGGETEE